MLSKSSTLTNVPAARHRPERESDAFDPEYALSDEPAGGMQGESLALSGSNQAREGRLVDALAARGDEGRDTLR